MMPDGLPVIRSDDLVSKLLTVSSQRSFKQICTILYVRMHAFTSMRRALTDSTYDDTHNYLARHNIVDRMENAFCAALRSLL